MMFGEQTVIILLAGLSLAMGLIAAFFLNRSGHIFYPSRTRIYDSMKKGFYFYILGNIYSVAVIIYSQGNNFSPTKELYYAIPGIILIVIGLVIAFFQQKKLAAGQQNEDIISSLKNIKIGLFFLLIPLVCLAIHYFLGWQIISWLLATIVGYVFILVGSYRLREIKILGLVETLVIINFLVFLAFLFLVVNNNLVNLQDKFLEIEIESLTDNVESHAEHVLNNQIIENYSQEDNQQTLQNFAKEVKTEKIKDVLVWDQEGRIVYSANSQLIGTSSLNMDYDYIEARNGQFIYNLLEENQENIYPGLADYQLSYYHPVVNEETERQIAVVGLFIQDPISENTGWFTRVAVTYLLGGFLLFFIIMLIIDIAVVSKAVIKPLNRVSQRAKNIVENNDYREYTVIEYESANEIGLIAKAINKLSYRLSQLEREKKEAKEKKDWHR